MTRRCHRCGDSFESDRAYHRLCWSCYWQLRDRGEAPGSRQRAGETTPTAAAARPLDSRLLRDAIALCHPDRHPPERAKTANAVTAALLELLQTTRKGGEAA